MYLVVKDLILSLMNASLLCFPYEIGVQVGLSTSSCSMLLGNSLQLWKVCMIFFGVEFAWRDLHMLIIVIHPMHFTYLLDCLLL